MEYFVIYYVDDFVSWYKSESIGKWFVENLGEKFHVNFLGYAHWFMSIRISQMKDHSISVDQGMYATSMVEKYMVTSTVNKGTDFYKTTFPSDMIFTKNDASVSDGQLEKLTRELNINYTYCIGSLIYFVYTRVYLSFSVHKL